MSSHQRNGNRNSRDNRTGRISPKTCKHFLIVTDAKETEMNYINGLKYAISDNRIGIKIKQENTQTNLVNECLRMANLDADYNHELWILFDCDDLSEFDKIIINAKDNNIGVAWSNPCIEIWFLAYFGKIPSFTQATQCYDELKNIYFQHTHVTYRKNDDEIYRRLYNNGDEEKAIKRMEELMKRYENDGIIAPSSMVPGSKVYELVRAIRGNITE